MTLALQIVVYVAAIDGFRTSRSFKTLAGAQRFAQERVGATPELGSTYAVAGDGVVKVTVRGCAIADLFPALADASGDLTDAEFDAIMREEAARERAYAERDARGAVLDARSYEVRGPVGCTCSAYQLTQVGCDCGAAERPQPAKRAHPMTAIKTDGGRAYNIFTGTPAAVKANPDFAVWARLTLKSPEGYDVVGGCTSDDEELADWVNYRLTRERGLDLRGKLAVVRECYERLADSRARESAAEIAAENAWLRAAEAPTNDDLGFEEYEARRLGGF